MRTKVILNFSYLYISCCLTFGILAYTFIIFVAMGFDHDFIQNKVISRSLFNLLQLDVFGGSYYLMKYQYSQILNVTLAQNVGK